MRPRFSAKEPTTTTVVDASDDLEAGLDDFPIDDDMDILQFLDDDDAPGGGASGGASSAATDRHRPDLDALGVAMEPSPSDGEHTIHAFVRWNHAVRREIPRREHLPTDSCSS